MKRKYVSQSWDTVFDDTSYYGVYGMDIYTLEEDSDIEVVSGPYKEYPEYDIELLNEEL